MVKVRSNLICRVTAPDARQVYPQSRAAIQVLRVRPDSPLWAAPAASSRPWSRTFKQPRIIWRLRQATGRLLPAVRQPPGVPSALGNSRVSSVRTASRRLQPLWHLRQNAAM